MAVDDLMMPVESHGVRMMSIGFLTEEDSPVIWRGPMLHKALTSFVTEVWWDDPDYLLVDLPPGTGDVALSIAQLLPTASLVIVTTPQLAAQRVARRAAAMAARVNLPVAGVIENMSWFVAPDTGARYEVFSGGGGSAARAELGVPLLGRMPLEAAVAQAGDGGPAGGGGAARTARPPRRCWRPRTRSWPPSRGLPRRPRQEPARRW